MSLANAHQHSFTDGKCHGMLHPEELRAVPAGSPYPPAAHRFIGVTVWELSNVIKWY